MDIVAEKEFAALIGQTKKSVLKAISVHLSRELVDHIDDVVQETYLRAFRALKKNNFRGDAQITTWLYVIAKNEALRLNKRLGKKNRVTISLREELILEAPDQALGEDLTDVVEQLPQKYRDLFLLKLNGFTEEEISKKLNISVGTIKSRTHRGKKLLAKLLA